MPEPSVLVVKKGTKMRLMTSGSIPVPLSLMVKLTPARGAGEALTLICVARASRALRMMLMNTCSSCERSALMVMPRGDAVKVMSGACRSLSRSSKRLSMLTASRFGRGMRVSLR